MWCWRQVTTRFGRGQSQPRNSPAWPCRPCPASVALTLIALGRHRAIERACRAARCIWFQPHMCDTFATHPQRCRSGGRQINDAVVGDWPPVSDAHAHRSSGIQVGHPQFGHERQRAVGRGQRSMIQGLTAGGTRGTGFWSVPRCETLLHAGRRLWRGDLRPGRSAGSEHQHDQPTHPLTAHVVFSAVKSGETMAARLFRVQKCVLPPPSPSHHHQLVLRLIPLDPRLRSCCPRPVGRRECRHADLRL